MLLTIENVAVSFGNKCVIDNVSASASGGEVVGLIGPNGSGKTTLLRFLSGLIKGDGGEIAFEGEVIDPFSRRWRAELSFVPDDGGTIPLLTVHEQLMLQCELMGVSREESADRTEFIVDLLSLGGHLNYRSAELSAGLRKRLGIGLGLIRDARIYLFDEPLTSLDVRAAAVFSSILAALKKSQRITVVASHTSPFTEKPWDRVWDILTIAKGAGSDAPRFSGLTSTTELTIPWLETRV